jgi:hypothetical protein
MLHLGIGLILAIPHFYYLGALIHVIWMPTHVWDRLLGKSKAATVPVKDEVARYKKTDGDEVLDAHDVEDEKPAIATSSIVDTLARLAALSVRSMSTFLQCTLLLLLVVSFFNTHIMETKLGDNVVAKSWDWIRFNNEWGMWSPGAVRVSPCELCQINLCGKGP